jgi:hypothetical protein
MFYLKLFLYINIKINFKKIKIIILIYYKIKTV